MKSRSIRNWVLNVFAGGLIASESLALQAAPPRPAPATPPPPTIPNAPGRPMPNAPTNNPNNTGNQPNGLNPANRGNNSNRNNNNQNANNNKQNTPNNNTNTANQGNGPNTDPNAPGPNGPNQNPYAPFNGPVGQAGHFDFGENANGSTTIPLGGVGFGSTGGNPWFLGSGLGGLGLGLGGLGGFGGVGVGPYGFGYTGGAYTNGYYGIGNGMYGPDNMAGSGLFVPGATTAGPQNNGQPAAAGSEEEQRQAIENAKSRNSLYYQFKETNRAYRLRQIARDRASPQALAKASLDSVPRWLGPDELDRSSGKIAWPGPFQTDEYTKFRSSIENALLARSTSSSSKNKENEKEIDTAQIVHDNVRSMVEVLRTHIEDLPADEYMTARKFLDSVDYAVHKSVPR